MTEKPLIDKLLSSEIKTELLTLFHKNPGVIDNLEGVARRIGRTGSAVEADLRDFVELGLVSTRKIGRHEVFQFHRSRDKEIVEALVQQLRSAKES